MDTKNTFESAVTSSYGEQWEIKGVKDWLDKLIEQSASEFNSELKFTKVDPNRPFTSDKNQIIWAGPKLLNTDLDQVKAGLDELIAQPEMDVNKSPLYEIFSNIVYDLNGLEGVDETRETAYLFGSFTNKYYIVSKGSLEEKKAAQACLTTLGQIVVGDKYDKETTQEKNILKLQLTQAKIAKEMSLLDADCEDHKTWALMLDKLKKKITACSKGQLLLTSLEVSTFLNEIDKKETFNKFSKIVAL